MGDKDLKWQWGICCGLYKVAPHRFTEEDGELWCPYCGVCYYIDTDPMAKLIMTEENKIDVRC